MASLKEIKGRITSVKSTLKITSAMKMVASAKLHKAQQAAERCAIYEAELADILRCTAIGSPEVAAPSGTCAVVAFSSNSSLCGGFNTNVIKMAKSVIAEYGRENVVVYAVGKKMAEALAKEGLPSQADYSDLAQHPNYAEASALAQELIDGYNEGRFSKVVLVWSHFVSTASQKPSVEVLLPFVGVQSPAEEFADDFEDYIIEPGKKELAEELLPKVLRLKVYSTLLDSNAAEHAARTVAMQTATDNGNEILADLTLEYNKGRQAKITSEILDLAGGAQQN